MRRFFFLNTFLIVLVLNSLVFAQDTDSCPAIVETALAQVESACADTERNEACYGNTLIHIETQEDVEAFDFDKPGDIADVVNIAALALSPMDETAGEWGVSLMQIQANLPDSLPGQNVTLLLFGDVEIIDSEIDLSTGAFYFQSGIGDAPCAEAPESGLLIQTPSGAGKVNLTVNGAEITLGSTAFLQAVAGDALYVNLIEGDASVKADGVNVLLPEGFVITVPLDDDLNAASYPSAAVSYDSDVIDGLPPVLSTLPEPIDLAAEDETVTCTVTPANAVNLRSGPGTNYVRVGGIAAGESEVAIGQAQGKDGFIWWELRFSRWVRSDIVSEDGDCEGLPVVADIPTAPTPASQTTTGPTGGSAAYGVIECAFAHNTPATAGQTLQFYMGISTTDKSESETRLFTATITVDGQPLSLFYQGPFWEEVPGGSGWSYIAKGNWTATSGTHTVFGDWSYEGFVPRTCTFTIE